jgi:hypothetical protein
LSVSLEGRDPGNCEKPACFRNNLPARVSTNLALTGRVHRPPRGERFQRLRRHAASQMFALAFITLILVPFTAPFPTYRVDRGHSRPYEALPKEFKNKLDSDDGLILPTDVTVSLPALCELPVRFLPFAHQVTSHLIHHVILRV